MRLLFPAPGPLRDRIYLLLIYHNIIIIHIIITVEFFRSTTWQQSNSISFVICIFYLFVSYHKYAPCMWKPLSEVLSQKQPSYMTNKYDRCCRSSNRVHFHVRYFIIKHRTYMTTSTASHNNELKRCILCNTI